MQRPALRLFPRAVALRQPSWCLSLLALALGLSSCKENPPPQPAVVPAPEVSGEVAESIEGGEVEFYADSSKEIKGNENFFFLIWKQPLVTKFAELPHGQRSVPREKIPYSGYWYPEVGGGTNARAQTGVPSALEKWDRAFHSGQSRAVRWEQTYHTLAQGAEGATWAGHCNGFAAAAQRHKEPERAVRRGANQEIVFEPHDIKALLAEIHMSAKYFFIGGSRCESDVPQGSPSRRRDPTVMNTCEDVNPGTFHVGVTNWIGRMGHAIIFDENAGKQVWNYPTYAYNATTAEVSKTRAMELIAQTSSNQYIFNPNATKFMQVTMVLTYANFLQREAIGRRRDAAGNYIPTRTTAQKTYTYVLEINAEGEVIGGEWTGASQRDHPDFIWVALEPVTGNGTREFGNPEVSVAEVIKIWAESIGADPNDPPLGIMEPAWANSWGKFTKFDMTLDGATTGAAFLGKKITLELKRGETLHGAVTAEIKLNGAVLTTLTGEGDGPLKHSFDASPGMQTIAVHWKREGGATLDNQAIRFFAVP